MWDETVHKIADVLEHQKKYQKILGKMAYQIAHEYSLDALKDLSEQVKDTYGMTISPATLKNYEYVYRITKELALPPDLSYRTMQYIASSGKPKYWSDRINKEGLSSADVYRLIREEKGLNGPKIIKCPNCGKDISL